MAIKLFNIEFDRFGSVVCAVTSVLLVVAALWALLEIGEYVVSQLVPGL